MEKAAYLDKAAARTNPHIGVAIVASTPISREIGQDYLDNAMQSPWECAMFKTEAAAMKWLQQTGALPKTRAAS